VHVVCDPRVRAAVEAERIELISFRDLTPGDRRSLLGDSPSPVLVEADPRSTSPGHRG
jgi:hypothetical protein